MPRRAIRGMIARWRSAGSERSRSPCRHAAWPVAAGAARTLADRRHGIDQRFQQLAIVPVGRRDPQGERDAVSIDENVALGARLAAIRRARARLLAPLFAGTLALSTAAGSQLMALA